MWIVYIAIGVTAGYLFKPQIDWVINKIKSLDPNTNAGDPPATA